MKNYSTIIILACVAGLLFSSCSRIENISVSKRHYRSGYHVDLGSRKQVAKASASEVAQPVSAMTTETAPVTPQVPSTFAATKPENIQQISTTPNAEKKSVSKSHFYASKSTSSEIATVQQETNSEHMKTLSEAMPSATESNEEVPYWVLIVFCFLLPPLAVGLKFGIVDKFWISILLTLLFWVPGVIYALILIID